MRGTVLASFVALAVYPGVAHADCKLGRVLELPVTMRGHDPVVPATIDGHATTFVADSGAFYSMIQPASAAQFGLRLRSAPPGFTVIGMGGRAADVSLATVKDLGLAGAKLHDIEFIVGGNAVDGAGLLGQNFFGQFEDEYDLPHGAVRLFRAAGCNKAGLAYWAAGRSYSTLPLEDVTDAGYHTVGTVMLNGVHLRAMFDTGAYTSIVSQSAAARAGVHPDSPGTVSAGYTQGIGTRGVKTWIGTFKALKIGDNEEIRNIHVRFGDLGDTNVDMLVGADFFLSHRVFVDNAGRRMFLTYEGGPVFDLSTAAGAVAGTDAAAQPQSGAAGGAAPAPDADDGEPTTADGFSRRGAARLARRDRAGAVADARHAVARAPDEGSYHRQLAESLLATGDTAGYKAELDAAIAAKRPDADALLMRAERRLHDGDMVGARADADAFAAAVPSQSPDRLRLASLYLVLHAAPQAVAADSDWIAAHPADIDLSAALNDRCWTRALAGIDLAQALSDCNHALDRAPHTPAFLDSRALVWFRYGQYAKAKADYDAALTRDPTLAGSLYMRGLAEARLGDTRASAADIDAATKRDPERATFFAGWGIRP